MLCFAVYTIQIKLFYFLTYKFWILPVQMCRFIKGYCQLTIWLTEIAQKMGTPNVTCGMKVQEVGDQNRLHHVYLKKLSSLPSTLNHVVTYSDTCGGQNRNINMAIMFRYVVSSFDTLQVIDQKFLLPGHPHLECDADHAPVKKAKKSTDMTNDFQRLVCMCGNCARKSSI